MPVRDICNPYDEQFKQKIKLARILLKNLQDRKDIAIALKWLVRVSEVKSPIADVKKNRNAFLSYIIKVLQEDAFKNTNNETSTLCDSSNSMAFSDYYNVHPNLYEDKVSNNFAHATTVKFHSKWSKDHSTYIAVKPIPGRGTIIYMAVSKKRGLENWTLQ